MAGMGAWAETNSRPISAFVRASFDVRVLHVEHQPEKAPVAVDEVVLISEAHRVPVELGENRQRHVEPLAVEDDVAPQGGVAS